MSAGPWWYVVGLGLAPETTTAEAAEFDAFYQDVHAPEVLAHNDGFVSCQRWRAVPRRPAPAATPQRLAFYRLAGADAMDAYLRRLDRSPADRSVSSSSGSRRSATGLSPKPAVWVRRARPMWRGFWRATGVPGGREASADLWFSELLGTGPIWLTGSDAPPHDTAASVILDRAHDLSKTLSPRHLRFSAALPEPQSAMPLEPAAMPIWQLTLEPI